MKVIHWNSFLNWRTILTFQFDYRFPPFSLWSPDWSRVLLFRLFAPSHPIWPSQTAYPCWYYPSIMRTCPWRLLQPLQLLNKNTVASFTTNPLIDIDGNAEIVGDLGRQRTHLIYIIDIKLSMNKSVFGFEKISKHAWDCAFWGSTRILYAPNFHTVRTFLEDPCPRLCTCSGMCFPICIFVLHSFHIFLCSRTFWWRCLVVAGGFCGFSAMWLPQGWEMVGSASWRAWAHWKKTWEEESSVELQWANFCLSFWVFVGNLSRYKQFGQSSWAIVLEGSSC